MSLGKKIKEVFKAKEENKPEKLAYKTLYVCNSSPCHVKYYSLEHMLNHAKRFNHTWRISRAIVWDK